MHRVIDHIDKSVRHMLRCPEMWGGYEAVELQVLQLIEVRRLALAPPTAEVKPRQVLEAYRRFSAEVMGGGSSEPLSTRLAKTGRLGELCKHLETFAALQGRAPAPEASALPKRVLLFGVDYDKTISADPDLFREIIQRVLAAGHAAVVVTGRSDEAPWADEVRRGVAALRIPGLPVVFAGPMWKREAALAHGYAVDIWFDDSPEWVGIQDPARAGRDRAEAPTLGQIRALVQQWLDKQGHEQCWYYPEIFRLICQVLGVRPSRDPGLPPRPEFEEGCRRYQDEQYQIAKPVPPR